MVPCGPRADSAGDPVGVLVVVGEHRGVEALRRVVGDGYRLLFVLGGDDTQHRAEYFFSCDRHGIVDLGKHRRLYVKATVEIARTTASRRQPRPFGLAFCNVGLDATALAAGGARPHLAFGIERIAAWHRPHPSRRAEGHKSEPRSLVRTPYSA